MASKNRKEYKGKKSFYMEIEKLKIFEKMIKDNDITATDYMNDLIDKDMKNWNIVNKKTI